MKPHCGLYFSDIEDVLDCEYYKHFWVGWTNQDQTIRVGLGPKPFYDEVLTWKDPNYHTINAVGISGFMKPTYWNVVHKDRKLLWYMYGFIYYDNLWTFTYEYFHFGSVNTRPFKPIISL